MIPPRHVGLVLGVLAAVLLAVMAAAGCQAAARVAARTDATAAVERAASAFVVRAGAVDPAGAAGYAAALTPWTTGPLRQALQGAMEDRSVRTLRRETVTRVETAVVTALGRDEAVVAVAAVQARRWLDARAGMQHERVRQRIVCRLERIAGRWLVAELRVLAEEPVE